MVESKKGNFNKGGQRGGNNNRGGHNNFNKDVHPRTPKVGKP